MSTLQIPDPDDYVTCPYDVTHRIIMRRIPFHILKCRKQHRFKPLVACPFDNKHMVPAPEIRFHMIICEDKVIVGPDIISQAIRQQQQAEKEEEEALMNVGTEAGQYNNVSEVTETTVCNGGEIQGRYSLPNGQSSQQHGLEISTSEGSSQLVEEESWDEDLRRDGVVVQPFKFGEKQVLPMVSKSDKDLIINYHHPLRRPISVVQINNSRRARIPFVYNYTMSAMGIGRGAGRGQTVRQCSNQVTFTGGE